MRSGFLRTNKYEKKISGDIAKQRTDALRKMQVGGFSSTAGRQVEIENYVKHLLASKGVTSLHTNYYILFAKKIVALMSKHGSPALITELEILQNKWSVRGLNNDILDEIKMFYVPSYTEGKLFKLDWSYLDGEDVLA